MYKKYFSKKGIINKNLVIWKSTSKYEHTVQLVNLLAKYYKEYSGGIVKGLS